MATSIGSLVKGVGGAIKEGGKALAGDNSDGSNIARKIGEVGGKIMRHKAKPKGGNKPVFKYGGKTMSA